MNAPAPVNAPGETACYLLEYKGVFSIGLGFGLVHVHGMDRSRPEKLRRYENEPNSTRSLKRSTSLMFFPLRKAGREEKEDIVS